MFSSSPICNSNYFEWTTGDKSTIMLIQQEKAFFFHGFWHFFKFPSIASNSICSYLTSDFKLEIKGNCVITSGLVYLCFVLGEAVVTSLSCLNILLRLIFTLHSSSNCKTCDFWRLYMCFLPASLQAVLKEKYLWRDHKRVCARTLVCVCVWAQQLTVFTMETADGWIKMTMADIRTRMVLVSADTRASWWRGGWGRGWWVSSSGCVGVFIIILLHPLLLQ